MNVPSDLPPSPESKGAEAPVLLEKLGEDRFLAYELPGHRQRYLEEIFLALFFSFFSGH